MSLHRAILILACIGGGAGLLAETSQQPVPETVFETVSLTTSERRGARASYRVLPSGVVMLANVSVRELIAEAYGVSANMSRFAVAGGADYVMTARFDIHATVPPGMPREQQRLRLRALLAERFELQQHIETREMPAYGVAAAREGTLGPQLRRSKYNCSTYLEAAAKAGRNPATDPARPRNANGTPWCSSGLSLGPQVELVVRGAGTIGALLDQLQGFVDRPLIDETALTGNVEWVVRLPRVPNAKGTNSVVSLLSALERQLGLKAGPRTAVLDVRVVDSVQLATPD